MSNHTRQLNDSKCPPHHEDSEYAAVGCALIGPTAEALRKMTKIIGPADFFDGRARIVFDACLQVADAVGAVDAVLVHDYLCESGRLSEIGGAQTLDWYEDAVEHLVHCEDYARVVLKNSIRRQVIIKCRELIEAAQAAREPIFSLRERADALAELLDTRMSALRPKDREREGLQ